MLTVFGRNYSVDVDYSQASARYFTRPTATSFTQWSTPNANNHWPQFVGKIGIGPNHKNFCSFWTKSNLLPGATILNQSGYFMTFSQGYGDNANDFFAISYGDLNQIVVTYRQNGIANQIEQKYQLYSAANASITGLATRGSEWCVGGSQTSNSNDFVHLAVGLEIPTYSGFGPGANMVTGTMGLYWNGQLLTQTSNSTQGNSSNNGQGAATYAVINGDISQSNIALQQTAEGVFEGGPAVAQNNSGSNIDELMCLSDSMETYEAYTQFYGISGNTSAQFSALATQLYGGGSPFDNSAARGEVAGSGTYSVGSATYRFETNFNNDGPTGTSGASPGGDMSIYNAPTIVVPHA